MEFLGVDIGGSGIKAGLVDTTTGKLTTSREKVLTPKPATPEAVLDAFCELVDRFDDTGTVGCTFPGVIRNRSIAETAANLDPAWIGRDVAAFFSEQAKRPVTMVNDADAAAIAEDRFGAARGVDGVVVVITLGTGVGTGLLVDGLLVPNTELGHLEIDGRDAEESISARAKERTDQTFAEWTPQLSRYLNHLENLLWPDLIVLGGGISRDFKEFQPYLNTRTPVVPAELKNKAGIVGAAWVAHLAQS